MCRRCFTKYASIKPLKDKKAKKALQVFVKIVNEHKRKTNKLWVDQEREFNNIPMEKQLGDDDILTYLAHNEVKSVVAERFIIILKGKIYKKLTVNDSKPYLISE